MSDRPVGVFDSGIGGLTVLAALERALPRESLLYFGDTARVPYGTRSPETVVRYAREAGVFLRGQGIKLLVVACNTASAVALDPLADAAGVPVVGVIVPGARRAAAESAAGAIGVIGTRATIASGAYPAAIRRFAPAARVISQACSLFVPLAEEGWLDDEVTRQVAARYLAPLREAGVDTLVLGCTHYPLLEVPIARAIGPGVALIDSASAVADEVRRLVAAEPALAAAAGAARAETRFFLTDVSGPFHQVAERFLGRPLGEPEHV
jgi:glutamate racemase